MPPAPKFKRIIIVSRLLPTHTFAPHIAKKITRHLKELGHEVINVSFGEHFETSAGRIPWYELPAPFSKRWKNAYDLAKGNKDALVVVLRDDAPLKGVFDLVYDRYRKADTPKKQTNLLAAPKYDVPLTGHNRNVMDYDLPTLRKGITDKKIIEAHAKRMSQANSWIATAAMAFMEGKATPKDIFKISHSVSKEKGRTPANDANERDPERKIVPEPGDIIDSITTTDLKAMKKAIGQNGLDLYAKLTANDISKMAKGDKTGLLPWTDVFKRGK